MSDDGVMTLRLADGRRVGFMPGRLRDYSMSLVLRVARELGDRRRIELADPQAVGVFDWLRPDLGPRDSSIGFACHAHWRFIVTRVYCDDPWAQIVVQYNGTPEFARIAGGLMTEPAGYQLASPWEFRSQLAVVVDVRHHVADLRRDIPFIFQGALLDDRGRQ